MSTSPSSFTSLEPVVESDDPEREADEHEGAELAPSLLQPRKSRTSFIGLAFGGGGNGGQQPSSAKVAPMPAAGPSQQSQDKNDDFGMGITGVSRVAGLNVGQKKDANADASSPASSGSRRSQRRQSVAVMRMMKDAHAAAMRISMQTQRRYSRETRNEQQQYLNGEAVSSMAGASPVHPHGHAALRRMDSVRSTEVYTEGDDDVSSGSMALDDFLDQDAHNFRARMNWHKAKRVLYALKVYRILKVSLEETKIYGKMVNSHRLSMLKLRQMRQAQERDARRPLAVRAWLRLRKAVGKLPVFFPDDAWRQKFDLAISILILYSILTVPVSIALFSDEDSIGAMDVAKYVIDVFFLADVFLNFRTAILVDEFHLVSRPDMIAYHYLTSWFALDMFTTLPIELAARPFLSAYRTPTRERAVILGALQFPRVLRLLRFHRIFKRIVRNMRTMSPGTIRIFRQVFLIVIFTHFMACTLIYVAFLEDTYGARDSWVQRFEHELAMETGGAGAFAAASSLIVRLTASQKYLYAFYWAIVTVTTVGYGDFKAETDAEAFVVVCCILLGASIYTFTIGNVTYMLQSLDRSNAVYDRKMDEVRFYMASKKVPTMLRTRVINYYKYLWSRHRFFTNNVDVIEDLSTSLKADILSHQARHILQRIPIFQGATESYLYKLSASLEPLVFSPGDRITSEGEHVREVFFITQGEVAVKKGAHLSVDGSVIALLGEGSFFGEMSVLMHEPRSATVVASTFTDSMILCEDAATRLVMENEEMRSRLMTVAAKRIERMAVWVTHAEEDGYVPLRDADLDLKRLVDKAKDFMKKVDKEKMETVVQDAAMSRTKTVRGPTKRQQQPAATSDSGINAAAAAIAGPGAMSMSANESNESNDSRENAKKKSGSGGRQDEEGDGIDLAAFLHDLEEDEHDMHLSHIKHKDRVMLKAPSRFLNRDVSVLVASDAGVACDDEGLSHAQKDNVGRASAKGSLPEPAAVASASSALGQMGFGVGGSRAVRRGMNPMMMNRHGGAAGATMVRQADTLMLKSPPEDTPLESLFVDVSRRCGMHAVDADALAAAMSSSSSSLSSNEAKARKNDGFDSAGQLETIVGMLRSLRAEFITTAAALWISYQSPVDLQRRYEDWPRGFVSTIYLILYERDEQRSQMSRVSSMDRR